MNLFKYFFRGVALAGVLFIILFLIVRCTLG